MKTTLEKLKILAEAKELELELIYEDIEEAKKRQTIPCAKAGCGHRHVIGKTPIIQTHWYTQPHGCTGGDYWNLGELVFVCNKCGKRNRIMFKDYDIPYRLRDKYNSEKSFRSLYKNSFSKVIDEHETNYNPFVLNYYVDQHRKRFGLFDKNKVVENG